MSLLSFGCNTILSKEPTVSSISVWEDLNRRVASFFVHDARVSHKAAAVGLVMWEGVRIVYCSSCECDTNVGGGNGVKELCVTALLAGNLGTP